MGPCRHGMLEGNWVEEIALQELNDEAGQLDTQTSFQRVLGHLSFPTVLCSTSADALSQAATLATRTKNAAYRYHKAEREQIEIWRKAKDQYKLETEVEKAREAERLKQLYTDTLFEKGRKQNQSGFKDGVKDSKQYSTIYTLCPSIYEGRSNQIGHGRKTKFTNPDPM